MYSNTDFNVSALIGWLTNQGKIFKKHWIAENRFIKSICICRFNKKLKFADLLFKFPFIELIFHSQSKKWETLNLWLLYTFDNWEKRTQRGERELENTVTRFKNWNWEREFEKWLYLLLVAYHLSLNILSATGNHYRFWWLF